jgi:hypothetical protein
VINKKNKYFLLHIKNSIIKNMHNEKIYSIDEIYSFDTVMDHIYYLCSISHLIKDGIVVTDETSDNLRKDAKLWKIYWKSTKLAYNVDNEEEKRVIREELKVECKNFKTFGFILIF